MASKAERLNVELDESEEEGELDESEEEGELDESEEEGELDVVSEEDDGVVLLLLELLSDSTVLSPLVESEELLLLLS